MITSLVPPSWKMAPIFFQKRIWLIYASDADVVRRYDLHILGREEKNL